jgi:hypothetical protein
LSNLATSGDLEVVGAGLASTGENEQMKVAYLVLAHRNPKLLQRVVRRLSSEHCAFFVHIDQKADIRAFSGVVGDNVFFSERRVPVYWGEFSQVEATTLLIRQAVDSPASYDYFVFLQGADYPLRSSGYIEKFLEDNRGGEFINLVKMPAPGYPFSKISKLRYPSDRAVLRFATRALARLGLAERDWKKYLGELQPYSGSAWWTLSRDACEYILRFAESNPHVEKYFRNTFTSDEMFFHTILGNSPIRSRVRRSLVYADWPVSGSAPGFVPGAHPAMLTSDHIRFFETKEKIWVEDEWGPGEMLFARKFSDDSVDLLQRIDEMIERKEECRTSP